MRPVKFTPLCLAVLCLFAVSRPSLGADAQAALDTLILGDPASERIHGLTQVSSEVVSGGLGEPARRLLPLVPVSYNGGSVSFTLKVDPEKQNYVTVKLWGSDHGSEKGRLILYIDGNFQLGYRHEGDHDVLNQTDDDPLYKDHFVYQTVVLPLEHTRGKTEVSLKIAALGRMWPYGSYFTQKQKDLKEPSRGIYRVYAHTLARFTPDGSEKQGGRIAPIVRPSDDGEEMLAQMKETVNARLDRLMRDKAKAAPNGRNADTCLLMAEAYHTPWTVAHDNPDAIAVLVQYGDAFLRPGVVGSTWDGSGPLGRAIARLGANPVLAKALDQMIEVPANHPVIGKDKPSDTRVSMTRREAWSRVLRANVDWQRTQGRRSYTNQSMIVDFNIYAANRGLMVIAPDRALPEKQALRYLYEAIGLLPWLGNDTADGGSEKPYGSDYYLVTRKGLSRELGFVASYGETILTFCRDMAEITGDPKIRAQLLKLQTARAYFRYPSLDADGYRTMKLTSEIDSRTAHFPQPNGAYNVCDVRESWWMEIPAFAKDPLSVGLAQQCLEDNQYFPRLAQRVRDPNTLGMMRNIDQYAAVKALPKSPVRLPMTEGRPDFVFSDEENAVVALKHGDDRLFLNFYFRQEYGVSGVTRILDVGPDTLRIATVLARFEVNSSGREWTRPDVIDFERSGGVPPVGEDIRQAWKGEKLPIAKRPDDATEPKYGKWGPFVGKAAFYHLRYGAYLFAINTTANQTYTLPAPAGSASAVDLVSGKTVDLGNEIKVGPLTTVVLYLGK